MAQAFNPKILKDKQKVKRYLQQKGFTSVEDAATFAWIDGKKVNTHDRKVAVADRFLRTRYPGAYKFAETGRVKRKMNKRDVANAMYFTPNNKVYLYKHDDMPMEYYPMVLAHELRHAVDANKQGRFAFFGNSVWDNHAESKRLSHDKAYQKDVHRFMRLPPVLAEKETEKAIKLRMSQQYDKLTPLHREYINSPNERAAVSWERTAVKGFTKGQQEYANLHPSVKSYLKTQVKRYNIEKSNPGSAAWRPKSIKYKQANKVGNIRAGAITTAAAAMTAAYLYGVFGAT